MAPITTIVFCLCSCLDHLLSQAWILQRHRYYSASSSSSYSAFNSSHRGLQTPPPLTLTSVGMGYFLPDIY
ncbi:hypothetical protein LINGRAPRIM_LOCUS2003 [Linum grandiflorum]